ncbi:hypothetical protein ROLI_021080 [Roseobacter fucihabitans]|uniref:Uncharacterized protein n=1 Tax=Roseobacter fucihabitans TaxID=1537242 RepID=A0ABZ2BSQ4_9RHOB|nr:hypothetical protein [Roseobacter litoralis]
MLCAVLGILCTQVDAFYYPDKNDLTVHEEFLDVGSVEQCRVIVQRAAAENGDPNLTRGDYECGVDPTGSFGDMKVYKETVR